MAKRKLEMPEDVRRMTAEMRKAYDNPDPRPQLRRGNPKAVSAAEDAAMLARLRGEPLSRKEIRELSRDNGNLADRSFAAMDALLEGLETAGAAMGPGPRVYGGSGTPKVQVTGTSQHVVRAGHVTRGVTALKALKDGYLTNASAAVFPDGSRFQVNGGVGDPYVGTYGRSGYPDVVFGIPEHILNRKENVYGNTDIGSVTQNSMEAIATRLVNGDPTTIPTSPESIQAAREYLKTHDVDVFNPFVRDLVYPIPLADHDVQVITSGLGVPEKPLPGGQFVDAIISGDATYGEGKLIGKVDLKSLIDGGAGVMLRGVPGTTPEKYAELKAALENYGFKVIDSPPEKHPDGTPVRIGGKYGVPKEPYVDAFNSIAPRIGHGAVSQASKGGNAGDAPGTYAGTRVNLGTRLGPEDEKFVVRDGDGNMTSVYGYPVRGLYPSEDRFFKSSPDVAGMAAEDGAIILNPYSDIPAENYVQVAKLEAARHHMSGMGAAFPRFSLTPEQTEFFERIDYGNGDRSVWPHTLMSRILVGDRSAGTVTEEQDRAARLIMDSMRKAATRQAAKAGDAGSSGPSAVPTGHNPALDGYGGPRIVINPSTFGNEKDGLCVAFDEAFRILMEVNGFDPVAEPTEKQRRFFADTAYNDDERMLRRTILARICTFDTSVTDPTDEQLEEAMEFLDTVMEIGAPQNTWEQRAVRRIRDTVARSVGQPEVEKPAAPEPPVDEGTVEAGVGGMETDEDKKIEEEDSGAEFGANAQAQLDEAAKLAAQGPDAEERKTQAVAEAAGKAAGDNPFGKSEEMKAAAQEAGLKADIAEAQKPGNMPMKNGHYVGARGEYLSERQAKELAERNARNGVVQQGSGQPQQSQPQNASERIGTSSDVSGLGGRELTAGETAWQARRQASTEAWMKRTGRSGDGVSDALAQRDERANDLRRNTWADSGRRDALGRPLDDYGRVIA